MKGYINRYAVPLTLAAAIAAVAVLGGGFIDPSLAALGAVLPFVIGDTEDVTEVMRAFEEFKKVNDERIKQAEKKGGKAVEDVEAKVATINDAIENALKKMEDEAAEQKALKARADALEATIKRLNLQGGGQDPVVEAKHIKAYQSLYGVEADVDRFLEHRKAFVQYMRKGKADDRLAEFEAKAMSVDSQSDGGFLVLPDTSGRMVSKIFETSPMRQVASVQGITTDALEGDYDLDEASSGWVSERGSRAETDTPQIGTWRIPVHEQYAEPRATQKFLDDAAVDVEGWLAGKVADKFSRTEATAFITGDGVGKPRGILTYPAGVPDGPTPATWRVIEQTNTGASGAFVAAPNSGDVFITAMGKMKDAYLGGASWAMNRTTRAEVRKLKDSDGDYLLIMDFSNGPSVSLLGMPVQAFEDMPAIAADSLSIALANWAEAYQIVDRVGVRVLRDPFTSKPFVKFYTVRRTGGDVLNFEAIKLIKFAA